MRQLNSRNIDRATVHGGHLSLTTASCGCCSEYFTNNPEQHSGDWEIEVDELSKHVNKLEEQLDALQGYLEDLNNLNISTLRHIED